MKAVMYFKMIVTGIFGILFVAVPDWTLSQFGMGLTVGGAFVVRFLGAAFILLAVMLWFASRDVGSEALRGIFIGTTVGDALGFLIALWAQLTNAMNALGWVIVLLYLVLAVGFGYYAFRAPEIRPKPAM